MNTWIAGTFASAGLAAGMMVNTYVDRTYFSEVVTNVVVDRVYFEGPNPAVDGHFTRTDRACMLEGVIGLVGSEAGWDRVKAEFRDAPDQQIRIRPPGKHKFRRLVFLGARNIGGADLLRAVTVHNCDTSGTGRMVLNTKTGEKEFAESVRKETAFFTIPFPSKDTGL